MTDPTGYAPPGPIESAPYLGFCQPEIRQEAFAAALAGAELGAYDRRIIDWLVQWDEPTCRTVVSLLWRVRQAAGVRLDPVQLDRVLEALADAATYRRRQAGETCTDCDAAPDEVCPDHLDDLDQADVYDDLARLLKLEAGR